MGDLTGSDMTQSDLTDSDMSDCDMSDCDMAQNNVEQNNVEQNIMVQSDMTQNNVEQNNVEQNNQNNMEQNNMVQGEMAQNNMVQNNVEQDKVEQDKVEQSDMTQSDTCVATQSDMTQTPSPSLTIDEPLTQQSTPKAKDYKRISDLYDPEELWNERDENDENEKTKKPKVGLSVEPELPTPWHRLFYKKSCDNNAEGLQDPDPEVRARAEKTVLRHVEWVTDLRRSRLTGEPTTMDKAWDQLADRWEDIKAKKIRPLIAEIQKEQTLIKKLIKKYDPKRINRKYERKFKRRALEESELRRVQRRGMMRAIELAYLRNPWEFPLLSEGDVKWYEGPLSQWRKKPSSPMREQRKKAAMLELVEWLQSGKHLQTKDIKGGQKQNNGGGKEPDGTHLEKKRDGKGKFSV